MNSQREIKIAIHKSQNQNDIVPLEIHARDISEVINEFYAAYRCGDIDYSEIEPGVYDVWGCKREAVTDFRLMVKITSYALENKNGSSPTNGDWYIMLGDVVVAKAGNKTLAEKLIDLANR